MIQPLDAGIYIGEQSLMPEAPAPSCVVLVVEDEWLVCSAVVDELTKRGCRVIEASSGEDALTCLSTDYTIDVLFTDLHLAGEIDGWDVAEVFRETHPDVGVIYTSGQSLDSRRDVPGSLYFPKPYSPMAISDACMKMAKARADKRP